MTSSTGRVLLPGGRVVVVSEVFDTYWRLRPSDKPSGGSQADLEPIFEADFAATKRTTATRSVRCSRAARFVERRGQSVTHDTGPADGKVMVAVDDP